MLTHKQIWTAIDSLAARHKLSPSGLAKLAGLDPTTFNRSKRETANGRMRWPSTESIAKVLQATGFSFGQFVTLVGGHEEPKAPQRLIPMLAMEKAGSTGHFDQTGLPSGRGWDEIAFPELADPHLYALEVHGDVWLPTYRDGDRIVVSPAAMPRRGDRVLVKTTNGEVMAKQLGSSSMKRIELQSFGGEPDDRVLGPEGIVFMHRIVWASQ